MSQPVSGPLTDGELRAAPVPVTGNLALDVQFPAIQQVEVTNFPAAGSGGLTDAQLRATSVPVTVSFPATQPVSLASVPSHAVTQGGPWVVSQGDVWVVSLASVPTHGVTQSGLWSVSISGTVAVSGPLTDTQLRAAPLAVTGTFFQATQPVSASALPLPSGASTEATLAAIKAKTDNLDVLLSTRTKPGDTQPVSGPLTDAQLRASAVPVSGFPAWPYPASVVRIAQQSANLANAQGTATLAAVAAKTTYLTSLQIFATGATAAGAVSVTIAGLLGGTMTIPFDVPAGVNLRATPILLDFATPLPASAVNTAIVVTVPALGSGNTRASVNAQGFQQ